MEDFGDFEIHPAAKMFPLMRPNEFEGLKADIKENGLRDPIVVCDGQILDGRNRYRACKEIGIEPKTCAYQGSDPVAFVISANFYRRHLNESQRALIGAETADSKRGGDRSKPQTCGLNHARAATNGGYQSAPGGQSVRSA